MSCVCVESADIWTKGQSMTDALRADQQVQNAARQRLLGAAPERTVELTAMWADFDPVFHLMRDLHSDGRLILDAGGYRYVRFNHRIMRAFWIPDKFASTASIWTNQYPIRYPQISKILVSAANTGHNLRIVCGDYPCFLR